MKILALDTATESCSVALLQDDSVRIREIVTPKGHAELILPMIDELLRECGVKLLDLDALAFGRGPGAFTGVRIAIGVVQGLAYGARKPVVGVSNLAAVAAQSASAGEILVCMDARMNEVYWCTYRRQDGELVPTREEKVSKPDSVDVAPEQLSAAVGSGFAAYASLGDRYAALQPQHALPHARDIARLAASEVAAGRVTDAMHALPVYLRDQVVAAP